MSDDPASRDAFRWEVRQSLVERLRISWEGMGDMANQQRAEAAVQISTMMDEIEAWRQAMQKSERDIKELRDALEIEADAVDHLHTDRNNLRLEVERLTRERDEVVRMANKLTAERDEARREACGTDGGTIGESMLEAKQRGWNCFSVTKDRLPDGTGNVSSQETA